MSCTNWRLLLCRVFCSQRIFQSLRTEVVVPVHHMQRGILLFIRWIQLLSPSYFRPQEEEAVVVKSYKISKGIVKFQLIHFSGVQWLPKPGKPNLTKPKERKRKKKRKVFIFIISYYYCLIIYTSVSFPFSASNVQIPLIVMLLFVNLLFIIHFLSACITVPENFMVSSRCIVMLSRSANTQVRYVMPNTDLFLEIPWV